MKLVILSKYHLTKMKFQFLSINFILILCLGLAVSFPYYKINISIDNKKIIPGIGNEYVAPVPLPLIYGFLIKGDDSNYINRSNLKLTENGVELGPAHSLHEHIRSIGLGAYSHWGKKGEYVQFSTSDNSDPRANARQYQIVVLLDIRWHYLLVILIVYSSLLVLFFRAEINKFYLESKSAYSDCKSIGVNAIKVLWRPILISSAIALVINITYEVLPYSIQAQIGEDAVDQIIVRQQFNRAGVGEAANILFVGDSSCLMGIDFKELQLALGARSVKSLCSMAYVGPAGYGKVIRRQIVSAGKPDYIVLFLHPISFKRDVGWDSYLDKIDAMERSEISEYSIYKKTTQTVQNHIFKDALFRAMPGQMGTYYGTIWNFAEDVKKFGGAIDPSSGLGPKLQLDHVQYTYKKISDQKREIANVNQDDYATNQLFVNSLSRLKAELMLVEFNSSNLYLAIAPIPLINISDKFRADKLNAIDKILNELGMTESQLLDLPEAMSGDEFSTTTHLNRWGRMHYTKTFSNALLNNLKIQGN